MPPVAQNQECAAETQKSEGGKAQANDLADKTEDLPLRTLQLDYSKLKMECKPFYPLNLVHEVAVAKEVLKKNRGLTQVHQLLQGCNDSGLITRQEIVSMLPPLLSDIKSDHAVFDMCAAPGSKTAQVLELIMSDHLYDHKKTNSEAPRGFVVANDADNKRAYLLAHQMNRLNTANIVITHHEAQHYPDLYSTPSQDGSDQRRFLFDRVLCDVPCSSDAAIRKMPQRWARWSPKEGLDLHPLQATLLFRGLDVLKVGGKLSYSTCSLNPIENEAVVAAALKQFGTKIRLL